MLACGLVIERIVVNPKCYHVLCEEISSALPLTEVLSPQVKMARLFGYPFMVEADDNMAPRFCIRLGCVTV